LGQGSGIFLKMRLAYAGPDPIFHSTIRWYDFSVPTNSQEHEPVIPFIVGIFIEWFVYKKTLAPVCKLPYPVLYFYL